MAYVSLIKFTYWTFNIFSLLSIHFFLVLQYVSDTKFPLVLYGSLIQFTYETFQQILDFALFGTSTNILKLR